MSRVPKDPPGLRIPLADRTAGSGLRLWNRLERGSWG